MGELPHGHGRHAVGTRPLDREVHRGDAGDLPEPQPAVEADGRAVVVERRHLGHGLDVAAAHPAVVERHQVGAVRVDAAQVGLDQVVGDERGLVAGHAERAEQSFEVGAEVRLGDDGRRRRIEGGHDGSGPLPSPRPSRPRKRMALPRTILCTVSASSWPNSSLATWCVFGHVLSWCG